jgi:hypothetical protein
MAMAEIGPAMRVARLGLRNRDITRAARDVYEQLLAWQRVDGTTEATLAALKLALEIGSDQLQRALNLLIEQGMLLKRKTRVWFAKLGRWVQGTNVYTVLLPSESRGRTTRLSKQRKVGSKGEKKQTAKSKAAVVHRVIQRLIPGLIHKTERIVNAPTPNRHDGENAPSRAGQFYPNGLQAVPG